ncbi:class I SAM-dependent methyltransferase [Marivirga sericea]|nr:class I SAM-dependent methyltransferase [Marivirga sericea]
MAKSFLPNDAIEADRYKAHNNDVTDPNYQKFVSPITDAIDKNFSKDQKGLDFGSGTGPVITKVLKEKGYTLETYDPFFDNRPEVLKETYDFIACCEVVEHFHTPDLEFQRLRSLLKPGGKLYIMTNLFSEKTPFDSWYYKNDMTHVFFYHQFTFDWIKKSFLFKSLEFEERLTTLSL